jgi:hypothetical protein
MNKFKSLFEKFESVTLVRIITEYDDDCRYYEAELYNGDKLLDAVTYYDKREMREHLKPYENNVTIKAENFTYYL